MTLIVRSVNLISPHVISVWMGLKEFWLMETFTTAVKSSQELKIVNWVLPIKVIAFTVESITFLTVLKSSANLTIKIVKPIAWCVLPTHFMTPDASVHLRSYFWLTPPDVSQTHWHPIFVFKSSLEWMALCAATAFRDSKHQKTDSIAKSIAMLKTAKPVSEIPTQNAWIACAVITRKSGTCVKFVMWKIAQNATKKAVV